MKSHQSSCGRLATTGEWRERAKAVKVANQGKDKEFKCGNKTKCSEMVSCEEAKFYYSNCGLSKLDGDKDGLPCNSLCK